MLLQNPLRKAGGHRDSPLLSGPGFRRRLVPVESGTVPSPLVDCAELSAFRLGLGPLFGLVVFFRGEAVLHHCPRGDSSFFEGSQSCTTGSLLCVFFRGKSVLHHWLAVACLFSRGGGLAPLSQGCVVFFRGKAV